MTRAKIACGWCGLFSRIGPVCEMCGSPLSTGYPPAGAEPRAPRVKPVRERPSRAKPEPTRKSRPARSPLHQPVPRVRRRRDEGRRPAAPDSEATIEPPVEAPVEPSVEATIEPSVEAPVELWPPPGVPPWSAPVMPTWMPRGPDVPELPVVALVTVTGPTPPEPEFVLLSDVPELVAESLEPSFHAGLTPVAVSPEEPLPARFECSRCGQPNDQPLCEACREAFSLLRAFSGWEDVRAG